MPISTRLPRHHRGRPTARGLGAALASALLATGLGLPLAASTLAHADSAGATTPANPDGATKAAVDQAKRTGKPVAIAAMTTPTTTVTANPSGTFTLNQSLYPTRVRRHGVWVNVDPTLHEAADGSLVPAAVPSPITLSGGGGSALATLTSRGKILAVSWPGTLPKPTLSGSTATYAEVLPGVDLRATVSPLGGFSEVLVVKNATAAANPKLARLALGTTAKGLTVKGDSAGNLKATDAAGSVVFTSPTAMMWDSSTTRRSGFSPAPAQQRVSASSDAPTVSPSAAGGASSADGPGHGAHAAQIPARISAGKLTLTPNVEVLHGSTTHYPVYIDPSWNPASASDPKQAYDEIQEGCPDKNALNSSTAPYDTPGVGLNDYSGCMGREEAYFQFKVDSRLWDSQAMITTATFKAMEVYSASCSVTSDVIVKQSNSQITSSTTWNNSPTLGYTQDTQSYGSACVNGPSHGFNVLDAVTRAASQRKSWVAFGMIAASESNDLYFRRFANNPTLTVQYDTVPVVASASTSPDTSTIGHTAVTLNAYVTDSDQGAPIQAKFTLTGKDSAGQTVYSPNSAEPANTVTEQGNISWFVGYLPTGNYTWTAQADDGKYLSPVKTRTFSVDATAPGAPSITSPTIRPPGSTVDVSPPARTSVEFDITPPASSTDIVKYAYNWGIAPPTVNPPLTIAAQPNGAMTPLTVVPSGFLRDSLQIYAVDAAGNQSPVNHYDFDMLEPAVPDATGDFTGDGVPDLLATGTDGNLRLYPAGSNGVVSGPVNITDVENRDFLNAKIACGTFRGHAEQDVLAITSDGQAHIYASDGGAVPMASTIKLANGEYKTAAQNATLDGSPYTWSQVTQVAADDSRNPQGLFPDLWVVTSDGILWWVPSTTAYGTFDFSLAQQLATGWQDKTLSYAGVAGGAPALWARDTRTGVLDLFTGSIVNPDDRTQDVHAGTNPPVSSTSGWTSSAHPSIYPARFATSGQNPVNPAVWATDGNAVHNINYYPAGSTAGSLGNSTHVQAFNPSDDFTSDGKSDIAASRGDGTLHLYSGQGAGQLTSGQQIWDSTWGSIYAMTSGDFNGDGKSDIVAIRGDNSLHLYPGTGTGGLDSLHVTQLYGGTTWSTAREITAGDFNGDGLADLVAIWNDGSLHLYANNGSGDINPSTLLWPDNSWVGFKLLSAGDYNGDGNSDILAVHISDGALHLYLGDGHSHLGTGTTVGALDWSTIKDIIPGDFSGDGKADLAAIWGDGTLHLYTGNGAGGFTNTGTMWNDNTWSTTKLAT